MPASTVDTYARASVTPMSRPASFLSSASPTAIKDKISSGITKFKNEVNSEVNVANMRAKKTNTVLSDIPSAAAPPPAHMPNRIAAVSLIIIYGFSSTAAPMVDLMVRSCFLVYHLFFKTILM